MPPPPSQRFFVRSSKIGHQNDDEQCTADDDQSHKRVMLNWQNGSGVYLQSTPLPHSYTDSDPPAAITCLISCHKQATPSPTPAFCVRLFAGWCWECSFRTTE